MFYGIKQKCTNVPTSNVFYINEYSTQNPILGV